MLVTNSGKPAAANEERLARLGIGRELYAALVSSGEAARLGIEDGAFGPAFAAGGKAHVVGRTGDDYGLERFPLVAVDLAAANALLILGSDAPARLARRIRRAPEAGRRATSCRRCAPIPTC